MYRLAHGISRNPGKIGGKHDFDDDNDEIYDAEDYDDDENCDNVDNYDFDNRVDDNLDFDNCDDDNVKYSNDRVWCQLHRVQPFQHP